MMNLRAKYVIPLCACLILVSVVLIQHDFQMGTSLLQVHESTPTTTPRPPEVYQLVSRETFTLTGETGIPMQYRPPPASNVTTVGRRFNIEPTLLESMGMPFTDFVQINKDNVGDFVLVTASSSNHFKESIDGMAGVQRHMPNRTLYYFDIGLKGEQIQQLNTYCNVVYRKFDFGKYPEHVRTLTTYAFKALIVQEMLREFASVFWMDASIRPIRDFTSVYPQMLQSNGYVQVKNTGFYNFAVTNKTMYEYIPTSIERQRTTYQGEANCLFFRRTESVYWGIIHWWILCALDRNCMAPVGAKLGCIFEKGGDFTAYMNCHRFDQSALGLLASNMFGYNHKSYIGRAPVLKILRKPTSMYEIQTCPAASKN